MISVVPLGGGHAARAVAAYFLEREAGCPHDLTPELPGMPERELDGRAGYYLDEHAPVGLWIGNGAAALGLSGALTPAGEQAFRELLEGRLGEQVLVGPVSRLGPDGQMRDVRRAGYDVTFSAPKSVSVLIALADEGVAQQARLAHQAALADAVRLLEQLSARAARGHHGGGQRAMRVPTDGVIGVAFEHHTSRADDPQLHTHVVLLNLIRATSDGRWNALDSRTLHRQATTASYLYQHRLRAELTARLGLQWEPVTRGVAEIRGIPTAVRREFSTRRRQIEQALTARDLPAVGSSPSAEANGDGRSAARGAAGVRARLRLRRAAQVACLATRPAKTHAPVSSLRDGWVQRASLLGFGPEHLTRLLRRSAAPPALPDLDELLVRVLSADGVTREASTFDQGTVLRELIADLPPGAQVSTAQLLDLTAQLVRDQQVVPVVTGDGRAYTTRDHLTLEQAALTLAESHRAPHTVVPLQHAGPVLARAGLRPEQSRLAAALLASARGVDVVSGPAGSGKTAALRLAAEQWQQHGLPVAGTAVAALAAQGLEQATGAPSVSLARLLHNPDRHLPAAGVLLVDEAGMVGTRQLHQLLTIAAERSCKVVLVGDPAQLPELEAGGLFSALTRQTRALTLTGHHRQREVWEQHALATLRAGQVEQALDLLDTHGHLHTDPSTAQLRERLVTDYLARRQQVSDPFDVLVLAPSRADVTDLNHSIRARLIEQGLLGATGLQVSTGDSDREYRVGEQVLVTRNDHPRGLLNGTTGTVTALTPDGLTLRTQDGRSIELDQAWLQTGRLDHAYALTVHKAQGRTVAHALLLANNTASRELGYVGLSRGTHSNHLYLDTPKPQTGPDCRSRPAWQPPPTGTARERPTGLNHSNSQQLALHQLARGLER